MLIEFKAANFRSIREKQALSLVAGNACKELPGCVIGRALPGLKDAKFLKGAAIFGANGSGKSNLLQAVHFLADFVNTSATRMRPGDPIAAEPFKLDRDSASKPSEFEIAFVAGGVRYILGVHVTQKCVVKEYLSAYPKAGPQRWYQRSFNKAGKTYEWANPSASFKHDRSLQEKTGSNALFLSVAAQFNHPQLKKVCDWFRKDLRFISLGPASILRPGLTADLLAKPAQKKRILNLLRSADVGVAGVKEALNDSGTDELKTARINLSHKTGKSGEAVLDFEREESAGTRRFFALAGHWLEILENGGVAFVDDIGAGLHPLLAKALLRLVFAKSNSKDAQVVFSAYDPFLLDVNFMRRDQIWFAEKTPAGATKLYSLRDRLPRIEEALPKNYLAGRYGAVPSIPEGLKL